MSGELLLPPSALFMPLFHSSMFFLFCEACTPQKFSRDFVQEKETRQRWRLVLIDKWEKFQKWQSSLDLALTCGTENQKKTSDLSVFLCFPPIHSSLPQERPTRDLITTPRKRLISSICIPNSQTFSNSLPPPSSFSTSITLPPTTIPRTKTVNPWILLLFIFSYIHVASPQSCLPPFISSRSHNNYTPSIYLEPHRRHHGTPDQLSQFPIQHGQPW